ncbi:hypothetical protein EVJ20_07440 [Exiguobacterium sp. SH0S1]|uniref:hypothetical protein n=1 Tax=Exiguobacterium sp. SH0S1 TaxID=2510949 RepID=UPI00103BB6BF|nr:hypothetical protein [Exiguobacterium sp. SH0S1]TCI77785.1 hypothetical protein EVJ20_07440 [Exiguobacterium sp. SH0S1]
MEIDMDYQSEIAWLAHQLEKRMLDDEPSIWKAIREAEFNDTRRYSDGVRQVYIVGEPEVLFEHTKLFDSIPTSMGRIEWTEGHPVLKWLTIHYYLPSEIDEIPVGVKVSLFVEDRLPSWSRPLFRSETVANVVSEVEIKALSRLKNVTSCLIEEMTINHLIDDFMSSEPVEKVSEELYPDIPRQHLIRLSTLTEQHELSDVMDEAAADMLNTYWLQNRPSFPEWMPILSREVAHFLTIKSASSQGEALIERLKVWGEREKRIDGK